MCCRSGLGASRGPRPGAPPGSDVSGSGRGGGDRGKEVEVNKMEEVNMGRAVRRPSYRTLAIETWLSGKTPTAITRAVYRLIIGQTSTRHAISLALFLSSSPPPPSLGCSAGREWCQFLYGDAHRPANPRWTGLRGEQVRGGWMDGFGTQVSCPDCSHPTLPLSFSLSLLGLEDFGLL